MNQTMMPVPQAFERPAPACDRVSTLELVLDHYRRELLLVPAHQRAPDAWKDDKRRKYVKRLRDSNSGRQPLGAFATYQVVGADGRAGPQYLNDGLQRLTTLAELSDQPEDYDMDTEGVRHLLLTDVSVQHRHYGSHEEAMKDFQYVNFGTHLTAYELCHGYLDYMPDYSRLWSPLFDKVKRAMADAGARIGSRQNAKRELQHKHYRHDFALFYRFVTNEAEPRWYRDIGRADVQEFVDGEEVVEMRLRDELLKRGHLKSQEAVDNFCRFVAAEIALLEQVRNERLDPGHGLQAVLWRWLLDFAVWRRAVKMSVAAQYEFVGRVLTATTGTGQIRDETGRTAVSFGLGNISTLSTVAELVGVPEVCRPKRRRAPGHPLRPGYHNSHQEPFSVAGDGPTFPEPQPLNLARGAHPVEEVEDEEPEA